MTDEYDAVTASLGTEWWAWSAVRNDGYVAHDKQELEPDTMGSSFRSQYIAQGP